MWTKHTSTYWSREKNDTDMSVVKEGNTYKGRLMDFRLFEKNNEGLYFVQSFKSLALAKAWCEQVVLELESL